MADLRNPPWTRDELILALDLYLKHRDRLPDKDAPQVLELSALLNQIGKVVQAKGRNYRNPNGVYMKLNNFRALDPTYTGQGKTGLSRGGKADLEVWREFADKPMETAAVASSIRTAVSAGPLQYAPGSFDDNFAEAMEGQILTRIHVTRERNKKIVEQKKKRVLEETGSLRCETCGFDFERTYGIRGHGFIEAHHIKPIYQLKAAGRTLINDLALLCANCHRMIHARRPWLEIGALRHLIKSFNDRQDFT